MIHSKITIEYNPKCSSSNDPEEKNTKYAIANGFVIGSFPQVIKFTNKQGQRVRGFPQPRSCSDKKTWRIYGVI